MVKICDKKYTNDSEIMQEHFNKFPFELSPFQKWSIEATVKGQHSLITAFTGSGKTLPSEFAIDYYTNQGKVVIYCSPIKALSNQKFHDFKTKFPDISIGILTGDISMNPEAQCVIMTTEILENQLQNGTVNENTACVVFDEIHYLNDAFRGHVWENSILMLNPDIQLIMLSATIASPEIFAKWIETRPMSKKEVWICSSTKREVPLTHYSFLTTPTLKKIKDEKIKKLIEDNTNKLVVIKSPSGKTDEVELRNIKKVFYAMRDNKIHVSNGFALLQVCNFMKENEMLPAAIFVFSRKKVVEYAKGLSAGFLEGPLVGQVKHECESIIRRLPNFNEYLNLPEYTDLVNLIEKGIAYHHGGMLSIFREMVELMFTKYIKVLFVTETFACGINLPIKTTVFTQLHKFSDDGVSNLLPHMYSQLSGRAGRRGIDTVGHCIHLANMYRTFSPPEIKTMLSNVHQTLQSKFRISYNWVLNNLGDLSKVNGTMFQSEVNSLIAKLTVDKIRIEIELDNRPDEDKEANRKYNDLIEKKSSASKKQRFKIDAEIKLHMKHNPQLNLMHKQMTNLNSIITDITLTKNYLSSQIELVVAKLEFDNFIKDGELTAHGIMASKLRKVHPLVFAKLLHLLDDYDPIQIAAILSCFTRNRADESLPHPEINTSAFVAMYTHYEQFEHNNRLTTGVEYTIQYELMDGIILWGDCVDEASCKEVMNALPCSVGDFIHSILEINNIVDELSRVAEFIGNISLCDKLQRIPELTKKYIATAQSLYI